MITANGTFCDFGWKPVEKNRPEAVVGGDVCLARSFWHRLYGQIEISRRSTGPTDCGRTTRTRAFCRKMKKEKQ